MSERDAERYRAAIHAMQSGVAQTMQFDPNETTPKSLRVGVNSAMSDHCALAALLIAKGLITEDEYVKAVADQMERERESYEKRLTRLVGIDVTLG